MERHVRPRKNTKRNFYLFMWILTILLWIGYANNHAAYECKPTDYRAHDSLLIVDVTHACQRNMAELVDSLPTKDGKFYKSWVMELLQSDSLKIIMLK